METASENCALDTHGRDESCTRARSCRVLFSQRPEEREGTVWNCSTCQEAEHVAVCICSTRVANPDPKENRPLQGALSLQTYRFLPDKETKTEKSISGKILRNPSDQALCLFFWLRNSPCNDILIPVRVSGCHSAQITPTAKSTANTLC